MRATASFVPFRSSYYYRCAPHGTHRVINPCAAPVRCRVVWCGVVCTDCAMRLLIVVAQLSVEQWLCFFANAPYPATYPLMSRSSVALNFGGVNLKSI